MGHDKETNAKVALKMIRMEQEKEGFPITALREIRILQLLRHENIVNLVKPMTVTKNGHRVAVVLQSHFVNEKDK